MSKRISTSFNEAQIVLLNEILTKLLSGSDPKLLIRNKAFPSLIASVQGLKRRVDNPTPPKPATMPAAPEDASQAAHDAEPMNTLHPTHERELRAASLPPVAET